MHINQASSTFGGQVTGEFGTEFVSNQAKVAENLNQTTTKLINSTTMVNSSSTTLDPFDIDAEPIVFMSENRTPVMTDVGLIVISIIFTTCVLLLVILMPSIRRNKWRNFISLFLVISIGVSIPFSLMKNTWLVGNIQLESVPYDSMFRNQFTGLLKVEIGLNSMNVSLFGSVQSILNNEDATEGKQPTETIKQVYYNERFYFENVDEMQLEHLAALKRGLPYPILSVTEFFSQDSDGFNWTRQIRNAGFYTRSLLYVTFISWIVTILMMCILPAYFMMMLRSTCILSAASYLNYLICTTILSPSIITIYSYQLMFSTNYELVISIVCSIVGYYCAHYIEFSFALQAHDESLTIMDSEDYLKDRKAVDLNPNYPVPKKFCFGGTRNNSVMIPISDIEEKFASN